MVTSANTVETAEPDRKSKKQSIAFYELEPVREPT